MIEITDRPLDPQHLIDLVSSDGAGAINTFVGTVREQTKGKRVIKLEYEAYDVMAIAEMQKIVDLARERWPVEKVAIHHRTGPLKVGDLAVVIAVSTPHRLASFQACQFIIDTLKQTVPIWKKEIFEDGEIWVAAHP